MTITEYKYAATTVRALMAAEIAMESVNCGRANVTRAQAEKLRVEQAIPWTEINPLDSSVEMCGQQPPSLPRSQSPM